MVKVRNMINTRTSQIQKEILICWPKRLQRKIKEGKSTVINQAVNLLLKRDVHPNNFRVSCKNFLRGLIMRKKVDLDWYINITPKGFEIALSWGFVDDLIK